MPERIVNNPGRPKGYAHVKCDKCGYDAYIHGSEFVLSQNGGRYGFGMAWTDCGNASCDAKLSVSISCLPEDVYQEIK